MHPGRTASVAGAEPTPTSKGIEIENLSKAFVSKDGLVRAVDGFALSVESGEAVALLGPSGCGKTTILRCVAGLERPDEGVIRVRGTEVVRLGPGTETSTLVPPENRGIGMVFQSYALWPHMTVAGNVGYPLRIRGRRRARAEDVTRRVMETLSTVGCAHLADRYPSQLSGGQQQRVALARALIGGSSTILFDEPLSNLDATLRDEMRFELARLKDEWSFTALYVTHDQAEAMAFASRIAVMFDGRIAQLGTPEEVYRTPGSPRVAKFLGSPVFIKGTLESRPANADAWVSVRTPLGVMRGRFVGEAVDGQEALVCLRPRCLEVGKQEPDTFDDAAASGGKNYFMGVVDGAIFLGDRTALTLEVPGGEHVRSEVPMSQIGAGHRWQRGDRVGLRIRCDDTLVYAGEA